MESPDELKFYTNLIQSVDASGAYEVDELLHEQLMELDPSDDQKCIELVEWYKQACMQLSQEALWISGKLKSEDFNELEKKINDSPLKTHFQMLLDHLNTIKQASPKTRRKYIENESPKFEAHAQNFQKRILLIDEACK